MYPTSSSSIEIDSQSDFVPGVIEKNSSIVEIYFNSTPPPFKNYKQTTKSRIGIKEL